MLSQLPKLRSVKQRESINYNLGRMWPEVDVRYVKTEPLSLYLFERTKKEGKKLCEEHKLPSKYTIQTMSVSSYHGEIFYIFVFT
jgi:hypothetical protein